MPKYCSKCKTTKPTIEFYKSGDGFQAYCRDCMKEYRKKNTDEDKPDETAEEGVDQFARYRLSGILDEDFEMLDE